MVRTPWDTPTASTTTSVTKNPRIPAISHTTASVPPLQSEFTM